MDKLKKTLYIMCGVPGSGKSTWIQKHIDSFDGSVFLASRDAIRFLMLKDGEDYFAHENEVYDEFINQIKLGLENHDITIADATHISIGSRKKLLKSLGKSLKNVKVIAMVIKTDFDTIVKQNDMREGRARVPLSVLRRMNIQFTMPEIEEGFDEIWIYEGYKYSIIEKECG